MAQELEPLNLKITGNANGLSAALGKAQGDVSNFAGSIQSKFAALKQPELGFLGGLSSFATAITAVGASLAALGGYGLKLSQRIKT